MLTDPDIELVTQPTSKNLQRLVRTCREYKSRKHRSIYIEKRNLSQEIKRTTQKLKERRINKEINLEKINTMSERDFTMELFENDNFPSKNTEKGCSKNYTQFIKKVREENAELKNRMKIFNNFVSDQSKFAIERSINNELRRIEENKNVYINQLKKRYLFKNKSTQKIKETEKVKVEEIKNFSLNFLVMDELLNLMAKNPLNLALRHEHPEMYEQVKERMINILIDNEEIIKLATFLKEKMKLLPEKSFKSQKISLGSSQTPFFLTKPPQKSELTSQITSLLSTLESMISQEIEEFSNKNIKNFNNFNKNDINFNEKENPNKKENHYKNFGEEVYTREIKSGNKGLGRRTLCLVGKSKENCL